MKEPFTALIITGQARTFARCFPNLKFQVFRKLNNPHFFVSVAADEDADSVEVLRKHYPEGRVFIEKVEQPMLPEPPLQLADSAPYAITPTRTPGVGPLQGILRQQWHLSRGYRFAMNNGADEAQVIVRCRPDLHFHKFGESLGLVPQEDGLAAGYYHAPMPQDAVTPYWGNYGGVNDRFAILGPIAAKAYFETYDNLAAMLDEGCPFHPESLVAYAMERAGIVIHRTLTAEFAFRRKDGSLEHMVVTPQELAAYAAHLV